MQAVYQIQNKITNDIYIGSSVRHDYRRWGHLFHLRKGTHKNRILQKSYNEHGEKAFEFSIVEVVEDRKKLIEREQYYIDTLNPQYNIQKNAASPLGVKHTKESIMNMSIAHMGQKLSPESIAKRTATVLGSKRTQDTINKMRLSKKNIPVIQCDFSGKELKEWISASEASRGTKAGRAHISACCRNERKSAGGFKWKIKNG